MVRHPRRPGVGRDLLGRGLEPQQQAAQGEAQNYKPDCGMSRRRVSPVVRNRPPVPGRHGLKVVFFHQAAKVAAAMSQGAFRRSPATERPLLTLSRAA